MTHLQNKVSIVICFYNMYGNFNICSIRKISSKTILSHNFLISIVCNKKLFLLIINNNILPCPSFLNLQIEANLW